MEKKTPLYDEHLSLGAKIVEFGGYQMPIQYSGVVREHMATREGVGIFDVSHMGEFLISGKDALTNLEYLITADLSLMKEGQIKYGFLCNEKGGVVDDLVVYCLKKDRYMVVVNASNREKDFNWIKEHLVGLVSVQDISDNTSLVAIQGPSSHSILSKICTSDNLPKRFFTFSKEVKLKVKDFEINSLVSKTGYTGEEGYEIYCSNDDVVSLWQELLSLGSIPCGLAARDTLRLEASLPLYGHELNEEITPLEADLALFVKLDKSAFIGKEALLKQVNLPIRRVGLKITGRGIAREGCSIFIDNKEVGNVTSGTLGPFLGYAIAMGYLHSEYTQIGTSVEIDVRGRRIEAEVVAMPFYKREKRK